MAGKGAVRSRESVQAFAARRDKSFRLVLPARRFAIGFTAFFFITRAYQDALYRLLRDRTSLDRRCTMTHGLGDSSDPINELVDDQIDDYREWFAQFKRLRDEIKVGKALALVGSHDDVGVIVQTEGDVRTIQVADAATGLDMSAALTDAIRRKKVPAQTG